MIGFGYRKLAKQYGLAITKGVAYGSLNGYTSNLFEGSGYKCIHIATRFPEFGKQEQLQSAIHDVNISKDYGVRNLTFGPRYISIVFTDTVGTTKKIQAFIEWFYPLLTQYGALGSDKCLECGTEVTEGGWYRGKGLAARLHDACAAHIQSELDFDYQQQQDEDTGSYFTGLLGALGGAILGAIVWALVLSLGFIASLVGLLIGWLAEKGYCLMRGKQGKGKIVILIFAILFGVLLGTVAADIVTLAQMISAGELPGYTYGEIPDILLQLLRTSSDYLTGAIKNIGMGLLFAGIGTFALLRKTGREVSSTKIKKLGK